MKTKKSFLWLAFLVLATIWILVRHNQQLAITVSKVWYLGRYTRLLTNMTAI